MMQADSEGRLPARKAPSTIYWLVVGGEPLCWTADPDAAERMCAAVTTQPAKVVDGEGRVRCRNRVRA